MRCRAFAGPLAAIVSQTGRRTCPQCRGGVVGGRCVSGQRRRVAGQGQDAGEQRVGHVGRSDGDHGTHAAGVVRDPVPVQQQVREVGRQQPLPAPTGGLGSGSGQQVHELDGCRC